MLRQKNLIREIKFKLATMTCISVLPVVDCVVNLLKAYPQYEAPVGYDALDMLSSTIGSPRSSSSQKKKMIMGVVVTPNIKK